MNELSAEFPVTSQTSESDKRFLLAARAVMPERFTYLEIGSFLGGTLTPFLRDSRCRLVVSVDDRERQLPDERGVVLDYQGITVKVMRAELTKAGAVLDKLQTHDGSIESFVSQERFDLIFIDGEHTDHACFRDCLWALKLANDDALIVFHDSTWIHRALRLINVYLESSGRVHRFVKGAGSDMSLIALGTYESRDLKELGEKENDETFYRNAEAYLLKEQIQNRVRFRITPPNQVAFDIEAPRMRKAF